MYLVDVFVVLGGWFPLLRVWVLDSKVWVEVSWPEGPLHIT